MITTNLIDLDKPMKDKLAEFAKTEIGCDDCLSKFPQEAQAIAFELIEQANNERHLVGLIDTCDELRVALNRGDSLGYLKEADAIVRYFNWINQEAVA